MIRTTGNPRRYAACLVRLVELVGRPGRWTAAMGALEGRTRTVRRVERLVSTGPGTAHRGRRAGFAAACLVVLLAGVQCGRTIPAVEVPGRPEAAARLSKWRQVAFRLLWGNPLPEAVGNNREVVALLDPPDREALAGPLRALFERTVRTPQPESLFHVAFGRPENFESLRRRKYLVLAASAGGNGPTAGLVRNLMAQHTARPGTPDVLFLRNVWARNGFARAPGGRLPRYCARA